MVREIASEVRGGPGRAMWVRGCESFSGSAAFRRAGTREEGWRRGEGKGEHLLGVCECVCVLHDPVFGAGRDPAERREKRVRGIGAADVGTTGPRPSSRATRKKRGMKKETPAREVKAKPRS